MPLPYFGRDCPHPTDLPDRRPHRDAGDASGTASCVPEHSSSKDGYSNRYTRRKPQTIRARGCAYFVKARGPNRIRITSASESMTFESVLISFCSQKSPATPRATIINVIVRISGTAVEVYLAGHFSSLMIRKEPPVLEPGPDECNKDFADSWRLIKDCRIHVGICIERVLAIGAFLQWLVSNRCNSILRLCSRKRIKKAEAGSSSGIISGREWACFAFRTYSSMAW
jgi:hypothetical protein